jgi:hypothetical protein
MLWLRRTALLEPAGDCSMSGRTELGTGRPNATLSPTMVGKTAGLALLRSPMLRSPNVRRGADAKTRWGMVIAVVIPAVYFGLAPGSRR